jgi:hypothetical protein
MGQSLHLVRVTAHKVEHVCETGCLSFDLCLLIVFMLVLVKCMILPFLFLLLMIDLQVGLFFQDALIFQNAITLCYNTQFVALQSRLHLQEHWPYVKLL